MTKPDGPGYREWTSYQATLLGGFVTLATVLLMIGNLLTRDAIAERRREDLMASLGQVIPAQLHDNDLLADTLSVTDRDLQRMVYRAVLAGKVTALAYEVTGAGYAGDISILMGLNHKGEILGVRVLAHAETPGLGDKIEVAKDDWILAFDGLSRNNTPAAQWAVKKDGGHFDQFTGATITPRAVVNAVKDGLDFFHQHQLRLLELQPTVAAPVAKEQTHDS